MAITPPFSTVQVIASFLRHDSNSAPRKQRPCEPGITRNGPFMLSEASKWIRKAIIFSSARAGA